MISLSTKPKDIIIFEKILYLPVKADGLNRDMKLSAYMNKRKEEIVKRKSLILLHIFSYYRHAFLMGLIMIYPLGKVST